MRKGKQKASKSKVGERGGGENKKSSKSAVEAAVNEGVKLQVFYPYSHHQP